MMNKKEFVKVIGILAELYDKELSAGLILIYYNIFKHYSKELFESGINYVIRYRKYPSFPKPAEIIEAIDGSMEDKSLIAWGSIINTIKRYGSYRSVKFEDSKIHIILENMGGWIKIAQCQIVEVPFLQKDFQRLYAIYEKNNRELACDHLKGISEITNSKVGYHDDEVVFVEDKLTTKISETRLLINEGNR